ncbi:Small subunit of serine palmitoyltransferase-like [Penicillium roqueforti FM164]|uniref:Small subunit of serine palmitoyltransferase-like n=2 Tax=Penicillium roqueforti TaxID=5082 RepID=W6Q3W0_PENRF|nr:Small subunit of serine palmitoyltransferase-like [Penicillium roqueforti FM164]
MAMMTTQNESLSDPMTSLMSQVPAAMNECLDKYSSNMKSSAPWRKPRCNIFQRASDRVQLAYYRYEVTFGLYVLTSNEKLVVNAFVSTVITLIFWALLYFPTLVYNKGDNLIWLLTGHGSQQPSTMMV